MREAEGQHGPAWGLPSPQLGQLPQAEQQAILDPHGVGDRGADGEPARSPQRAIGQGLEELRCLPGACGQRLVEDGDRRPARGPSRTAARTTRSPPARDETGRPAREAPGCARARAPGSGDRSGRRAPGSRGGRPTARAHPAPRIRARASSTTADSGPPRPLGGRVAVIARASSGSRSSRSTRSWSLAVWLLLVTPSPQHANPVPAGRMPENKHGSASRPSSRRRSHRIDPIPTATATGAVVALWMRPIAGFRLARPGV